MIQAELDRKKAASLELDAPGPFCDCNSQSRGLLLEKLGVDGYVREPCILEAQGGVCNPRPVLLSPKKSMTHEDLMAKLFGGSLPIIKNNMAIECGPDYEVSLEQVEPILSEQKPQETKLKRSSLSFKITETLFSEYVLCHFIKYDPPLLFNKTTINVLKITHYVNKNLFWKFFLQTNSDIDKINFHVVCAYTFKPPYGSIQLVYQKGTARFGVKGTQGHTLFLKLGYMF